MIGNDDLVTAIHAIIRTILQEELAPIHKALAALQTPINVNNCDVEHSVRLGQKEKALMNLIPVGYDNRVDTTKLLQKYNGGVKRPVSRQTLVSQLNRIQNKLKTMRSNVMVTRTQRLGPYPVEVWIEKRKD
jgi:hypothetical protein